MSGGAVALHAFTALTTATSATTTTTPAGTSTATAPKEAKVARFDDHTPIPYDNFDATVRMIQLAVNEFPLQLKHKLKPIEGGYGSVPITRLFFGQLHFARTDGFSNYMDISFVSYFCETLGDLINAINDALKR
jgi:hypothetical protein